MLVLLLLCNAPSVRAIDIIVDYTLDEQNENWFNPNTAEGLARRASVDTAAAFLSEIITNDDWQPLSSLNEAITFTDIAASTIRDLNGNLLFGSAESDGEGYSYSSSSNDVHTTNRSSVGANEYIIYVGAFMFDSGSTANAKGGYDSNDRRNAAGFAGTEFNTWGGKIYFNTAKPWYAGSNPGIDPTDNYGVQDSNKNPTVDISTDNYDWSTSSDSWKGFDLTTIDPASDDLRDLYATTVHELMHALGATSSIIEDYVGVNSSGDFIGENLVEVYGGPVPGDGGHFAVNTQSLLWDSDDIISETVLDPNSLANVRKYFTQVDAALLRDLGYQVLESFPTPELDGDYNSDGTVDAADYTVWRNNLGAPAGTLPNDPEGGAIGIAQYQTWKQNFGSSLNGNLISPNHSVPEPTSLLAISTMLGILLVYPRLLNPANR